MSDSHEVTWRGTVPTCTCGWTTLGPMKRYEAQVAVIRHMERVTEGV